jgi:hypothetical protein
MRGWLPVLARILEHTLIVAGVALIVHTLWELAQLSCYQFVGTDLRQARAIFVIARLRSDVGLSVLGFLLACIVLRDSLWLSRQMRAGVAIMALFGLMFASAREWLAVQSGAAVYSVATTQVFDVALLPLLQWLIVPVLLARLAAPLLRQNHR